MKPVPTLDAIVQDPGLAQSLAPDARHALQMRAILALAALAVPPSSANGDGQEAGGHTGDRLLTAKETAARLSISVDQLYRMDVPFRVRVTAGRAVRFSAAGLEAFLRQRQGRP